MSSFLSNEELYKLGLKSCGKNVQISRYARIYRANEIEIGDNVRIDDFCFLSGKIKLKNYIHIAPYSELIAGNIGIQMSDYSGLSSKVTLYAVSDDYSGNYMTNPTVPIGYTNMTGKKIELKRHVIVGTSTVILQGVTINEGTAIGACSLVIKDCDEWSIYTGVPAKKVKARNRNLLKYEQELKNAKIKNNKTT